MHNGHVYTYYRYIVWCSDHKPLRQFFYAEWAKDELKQQKMDKK